MPVRELGNEIRWTGGCQTALGVSMGGAGAAVSPLPGAQLTSSTPFNKIGVALAWAGVAVI